MKFFQASTAELLKVDIFNNQFHELAPPDIGTNIWSMILIGIIAYVLLLSIEFGVFKWMFSFIPRRAKIVPMDDLVDVDDDVQAEKEQINNMTDDELRSQAIVMKNVSKFYGKFCAIKQISLSIKR